MTPDLDSCPVCRQKLHENSSLDRVCAVCGMTIEESTMHFAVAGRGGLHFLCSPECTRSYVALETVTGGRG